MPSDAPGEVAHDEALTALEFFKPAEPDSFRFEAQLDAAYLAFKELLEAYNELKDLKERIERELEA